jgi:hypothetical protein
VRSTVPYVVFAWSFPVPFQHGYPIHASFPREQVIFVNERLCFGEQSGPTLQRHFGMSAMDAAVADSSH